MNAIPKSYPVASMAKFLTIWSVIELMRTGFSADPTSLPYHSVLE